MASKKEDNAKAKKAAAATAKKQAKAKAAADKKKNGEMKVRKPRFSSEEYAFLKYGLEALVREEEGKEVKFAENHVSTDKGADFSGTYADLCELYAGYGKTCGTILRTKAIALIEKVAPHVSK